MSNDYFFYYFAQVCLVLFILLLLIAFATFVRIQLKLKKSELTEGTVVSVRLSSTSVSHNIEHSSSLGNRQRVTTYIPTFSYKFNGKDYVEESDTAGTSEEEVAVGVKHMLHVSLSNPKDFQIQGAKFIYGLPATLCLFALILIMTWAALTFGFGANTGKTDQKLEELEFSGKGIDASVVLVQESASQMFGEMMSEGAKKFAESTGEDPWTVFAEWESLGNGIIYKFQSKNLKYKPGLNKGDKVTVFIDPDNPKRYIMRID